MFPRIVGQLFGAALIVLTSIAPSPASSEGTALEQATANFAALPRAARYEIQMLLIAAGYSVAVSNDTYNSRTFDAITRFQSENGFTASGSLTADQFTKLRQLADPALQKWGLTLVRHPHNKFPLWVPANLRLVQKQDSSGLTFTSADDSVFIIFNRYAGRDTKAGSDGMLELLKSKGLTVSYSIVKPSFFVISTTNANFESYVRYEVGRSDTTGFLIMWKPDRTIFGTRLTTMMSDLFRAAAHGDDRSPPTPTAAAATISETPQSASVDQPGSENRKGSTSSGSGFFVSAKGNILTNAHVVDGCTTITASQPGMPSLPAMLVAKDVTNDLALLKIDHQPAALPSMRSSIRVGEGIAAYGFPLVGVLATSGNFTVGNVTATAGLQDDSRMLQVSSPVQPGNSGGPLLDESGNIVGVVVAKLDALKFAALTQDVPQNINFAIKSAVALTFLDANRISMASPVSTTHLPPEDIAEKAKDFAVYIECTGPTH